MSEKLKYIRTPDDYFIVFPMMISHDTFANLKPVSAGFCHIMGENIKCFGDSFSLKIKSKEEDSDMITRQFFGLQKYLENLKSK